MDVAPHRPSIPVPPPALVYTLSPALVLAPEKGIGPNEPIPEPQDALKDTPEKVDQQGPLNGFKP